MATILIILGFIFLLLVLVYFLIGAWQYQVLVIRREVPLEFGQAWRCICFWPLELMTRE